MRAREYDGRGHSDVHQTALYETDSEGFPVEPTFEKPLENVATASAVITAQTAMDTIKNLQTRTTLPASVYALTPEERASIQADSVDAEGDWYGLSEDI